VSTMIKYIGNVARSPDEDKFRSISMGNAAFQARVASVPGAVDFFKLLSFQVNTCADRRCDGHMQTGNGSPGTCCRHVCMCGGGLGCCWVVCCGLVCDAQLPLGLAVNFMLRMACRALAHCMLCCGAG
jgi:hypothetical protein